MVEKGKFFRCLDNSSNMAVFQCEAHDVETAVELLNVI